MYVLLVISFTTAMVTAHDFDNEAACEAARKAITMQTKDWVTKSVPRTVCIPKRVE